jgi:multicomponent Na+:H+ antiporter subunit A
VALIFMLFGAPDLSFTQFMVETLSVVILALVLTRLALFKRDHRSFWQSMMDGVIAIACGIGLTGLLLSVLSHPFDTVCPNSLPSTPIRLRKAATS